MAPALALALAPLGSHAILNHVVHHSTLDVELAALADPTRRAVLERLARGPASISELAEPFGMTLTGMKKHVGVLEGAGLVSTQKVGRVRHCSLGPRSLEDTERWLSTWRSTVLGRIDRFADLLERRQQEQSP